jgi:hypothetical protein
MKTKLHAVLGLAGIATLIASLGAFVWSLTYAEFGNRPFNDASFQLQQWRLDDVQIRGRMADDLIARHLPVGMSQAVVFAFLGEPNAFFLEHGVVRYWMGDWSGYRGGMDAAWLEVGFDSDGKLIEAFIAGG